MADNKILIHDLFKPENVSGEVAEYWITILSRRWFILLTTLAVTLVMAVYMVRLPNLYRASVDILVEYIAEIPKTSQELMMPSAEQQTDDYYGTQIAILTGRRIAQMAEQELGSKLPPYKIEAIRLRETRILSLSCKTTDAETAARIANKYAEVYVRESAKEATYVTQQMLKWIPDDLEMLENKESMEKLSSKFNKKEFAESLASVTQDPVITKMRTDKLEIESKLQELSRRYKPQHPVVLELKDRLVYVERELKQRTKAIIDNLRANLAGEINITNVRVLQEALPPSSPVEPNRPRGILLAAFAGLILSVWFTLVMEELNQKIRTERDLASIDHLPFLGYVPLTRDLLKRKKSRAVSTQSEGNASIIEILKRNSLLADAVANVRTRVLFSVPYERSKRIMITSAIPDEGKSTVAALLAHSLTGLGRKILLIDADMRKPFTHHSFNLPNEKGITDFLTGEASLGEIIRTVPDSTLKVITGGTPTENPSELLSSERFRELLDTVGQEFDRIVIDVPPVLFIPDGLVVAKHVHTGVLVCGSGMVHKKTVKEIKEKFDQIGYSFIGAVINRADYENEGYRYKYFNNYRKYYKRDRVHAAAT